MNLLAWFRRRASARRDHKERPEMAVFRQAVAELQPTDIVIDCGANVGLHTLPMAKTGATVHAFEPNPAACQALRENTAAYLNVRVYHAAVTTAPGPVKLYLHKWTDEDPVHWSTGSSLLDTKNNVRKDRYTIVAGIQLSQFIRDVGESRIRLLKMDIEGAEVAVLNQLLDEGLHEAIGQAFIEVHDRRVPELVEPTRKLRERLRALHVNHFRLDWR